MKKSGAKNLCFGLLLAGAMLMVSSPFFAQSNDASSGFLPLDQWRGAILAGDANALKALYSTNPAAQVQVGSVNGGADADLNFWRAVKSRELKLEIVRLKQKQPDRESVIFKTQVEIAAKNGELQTMSLTEAQGWRKQGDQWRITGVERTDAPQLAQPSDMNKNLYPANADAHAEIKEAEEKAAAGHKRVLLVFGANWCFDCHVLDLAFHRPDFASTMAGYEVVHVDLGDDEQKNAGLVKQYEIPLNKGIPALAVVASNGSLIVSQKNGEFEDARSMTPEALLEFLNKWKPTEQ
jgi:thioredoxin 1